MVTIQSFFLMKCIHVASFPAATPSAFTDIIAFPFALLKTLSLTAIY